MSGDDSDVIGLRSAGLGLRAASRTPRNHGPAYAAVRAHLTFADVVATQHAGDGADDRSVVRTDDSSVVRTDDGSAHGRRLRRPDGR